MKTAEVFRWAFETRAQTVIKLEQGQEMSPEKVFLSFCSHNPALCPTAPRASTPASRHWLFAQGRIPGRDTGSLSAHRLLHPGTRSMETGPEAAGGLDVSEAAMTGLISAGSAAWNWPRSTAMRTTRSTRRLPACSTNPRPSPLRCAAGWKSMMRPTRQAGDLPAIHQCPA